MSSTDKKTENWTFFGNNAHETKTPWPFLTFPMPMAYKTNLLVMTAGGYKFNDFVKVGIPLTILMWATLSIILTVAYDL